MPKTRNKYPPKVGRDWKARPGLLTAPQTGVTATTCALLCCIGLSVFAQSSVLYENNFEKEPVGKVPENFLVLDGGFAIKEEAGNKFLELPGSPLDSYSVQF